MNPAQTGIEGLPRPVLDFNPVPEKSEAAVFGHLREPLFSNSEFEEDL